MPPMIRRSRTLVAALCCAAAAAVALTTHVVVLIVACQMFEPPPDMEGPSVFVALLMVTFVAGWMGLEALTVWIVFADALRRFPRRRWTSFWLLVIVAALHLLLTAMMAGSVAPGYLVSLGAVVPPVVAAAMLLARAPA
jgi:hypothetical protein